MSLFNRGQDRTQNTIFMVLPQPNNDVYGRYNHYLTIIVFVVTASYRTAALLLNIILDSAIHTTTITVRTKTYTRILFDSLTDILVFDSCYNDS